MENGWKIKCGLPSSSEQFQLQEARNQVNMNSGHCILPHDAPGPPLPHLKQAPTSKILAFGSCKLNHPETSSSFHSLLSMPPSQSQYDFQQHINEHTSGGGCCPGASSQGIVGATPNWPHMPNSVNFNTRAGVDRLLSSPLRTIMDMDNGMSHGLSNDLDALRSLITHGGSKKGNEINNSLQEGVLCASSSSSTVPSASLHKSDCIPEKQMSVENESPRVFCLGACGELIFSSTGLFGIQCSCHGMRMSVYKFCEHAGLSDANPGYAVRMDCGKSIAQWRKEYLQKFGIRAPGDHKGWDWSEDLLATSALANNRTVVADRRKVFDLSSLFNSSAESSNIAQPRNTFSLSRPQLSQEYSNQTLDVKQWESVHDCSTRRSLTPSFPSVKEESRGDCELRSFYNIPYHENLYSSACEKLPSFCSKAYNSNKDDIFERGANPSSIELKLGQSVGSESSALSTVRPHTTGVQTSVILEKSTHNWANAKVGEHSEQNLCHSGIEPIEAGLLSKGSLLYQVGLFNNAMSSFQGGRLNNAPASFLAVPLNSVQSFATGAARTEHVKDGLHKSLAISKPSSPTNTSVGGHGGSFFNKEISKTIINSHPFSSFKFENQPCSNSNRSVLINFACNAGDASIQSANSNTLVLPKDKGASMDATCGHKIINMGNLTSCGDYAKRIENSCFTRNGICNSNTVSLPAPNNLLGVSNMLSSISGGSEHVGIACNLAPSIGFTPSSAVMTPVHDPVSCSKHVEAMNSHMSVENSRLLALRNVEKALKGKPIDGSLAINKSPTIRSNERQENISNSDLRAHKLFLDQWPLQRQNPLFCGGHTFSSSFLPNARHKKGMNLGAVTEEMKLLSELTEKSNGDPCHSQLGQHSSPSGQASTKFECNMMQRFCGGPSSHSSGRCKNNFPTMCTNMERGCNCNSSIYGLKKQAKFAAVETPKHSGLKLAEKKTFLAYNQKDKNHDLTLDCTSSQWIDSPFKENSAANLKEYSAKGTPQSNCASELQKDTELSDISSDCSVLAVTQASNDVNIIDQGSATSRSSSSVEAIESAKSSQFVCDGKIISTEEPLTFDNIQHHSIINLIQHTHSKSNEMHNIMDSSGGSGEISNKDQTEKGFKPRKRKQTTKWKMLGASITIADVSQLPHESQVRAGSASSHCVSTSEDGLVLLQSNQDSSRMGTMHSSSDSLKHQRYAVVSHKRDLNGLYNSVGDEPSDQRLLKDNNDFVDMPERPIVKKLKQVKRDQLSDVAFQKVKPIAPFKKVKPIACGKYGIICDQELDINLIKPPKIVPLSQVLNATRRHAKFEKAHKVPSKQKKKKQHYIGGRKCFGSSCNFRQTQGWAIDNSSLETQLRDQDNAHFDDLSKPNNVGHNEGEKYFDASTRETTDSSKTKEARLRSLYELSIKGNKYISADISRSQNVMCAKSTVLESTAGTLGCEKGEDESRTSTRRSSRKQNYGSVMSKLDELCCVCGISNNDDANWLLECGHCLIRIHQACYGISRAPKGEWYCRPCRTSSKDVACVLCGYGGGAMTRAFGSRHVVKSLLKAWDIRTEPHMSIGSAEALYVPAKMECRVAVENETCKLCPSVKPVVHNSIISGLFDPTVKQWLHVVCGLWTPGTRCPNVDTMSAFDVSGVSHLREHMVCYICKRAGGSSIKCRVETCSTQFHPWCAHQKGLLQSEVEGVDSEKVGFYGRCLLHADDARSECCPNNDDADKPDSRTECEDEPTCARTKGYQGRKHGLEGHDYQHCGKSRHLVSQVQVDAWHYINTHKLKMSGLPKHPVADVDQDYRKEYSRYKQAKGWKQLVVYKSGIHALGLYTSQFIQRGAMVVEYIGEIVGPRVADKRESEYLSGRKLQYKSACYFFRIDKEQIIDATCKGGIARFVNHSCQPNCLAKVLTIRGEKKVVFLAQRDINPGEEITYDYHFNHEDEGKKIPCFCNSKNCRRYMN